MEVTKTTQGRNKVLHQGYAYGKQKNLANGWESYECERRRVQKVCRERVKINGQQIVIVAPKKN